MAEAILTELAERASQRREDAAREEAKLVFKLGEIAEGRVDWANAAQHYARAADLAPDFERLFKAREFAWRAGDYPAALRLGEDLLRIARTGTDRRQLATAMNEHGLTLRATGRLDEAEPLYREDLEIWRGTLAPRHPAVATTLNNLALLLRATGRADQATPLYLEATAIFHAALGDTHPDTRLIARNTPDHLRDHAPDHPDLPGLAAGLPDP